MKLQRGVHSYFKIVPLETDQKSPPPSRFSLNSSFFFFQGKKILSGGKIPPDTLLLRGKAVLYIVACQFLTFEDRSGLKLNFPANLPREREWFCNRVDIIVSCVTLHEGKGRKFSFPRLSKLARKEKEKKKWRRKKDGDRVQLVIRKWKWRIYRSHHRHRCILPAEGSTFVDRFLTSRLE